MPTLHIHLDETGDWRFTPKSPSKYLILTLAWTYDPRPLAAALTSLRFSVVKAGTSLESFHATEDRQAVRNQVVQTIMAHQDWWFAAVVMEKRKINPVLYEPDKFYPKFASPLLKFVFRGRTYRRDTDRVLVYADTLPMSTNAKREGVLKALKETCADCLPDGVTHHVYSYRSHSNKWLQVADYCCWAMSKKWEKGDVRTYDQLYHRLKATELVITDSGDGTTYY
jgi:hypothetical protein